jgi:hypothetical protein
LEYHFDVEHAKRWGVEEAIFLQNLIYWLRHNKANKKSQKDGHTWSYNTLEAFAELFPFWSVKQIRRIVASLIEQKVIIKGCYNERAYDRTCWYALADESLLELPAQTLCPNGQMEKPKQTDPAAQTDTPIPDIKQDQNHKREKQAASCQRSADIGADSLSSFIGKLKEKAQTHGAPAVFVSSDWSRGIGQLRRSGVSDSEILGAFATCLEQAPERVTFFPRDFLKWRKVSRERVGKQKRLEQQKREGEMRRREREEQRENVLKEREDPGVAGRIEEAIAALPWKRVKGGGGG